MTAYNLNDDNKTRLIKEAWETLEQTLKEGDITRGTGDGENIKMVRKVAATGTAKNVRTPLAKPPAGVENLAEEETEDTGAPQSGEEMAGDVIDADSDVGGEEGPEIGGDEGAIDAPAELSPWERLTAAAKELSSAIEAIAAEESGEAEHGGEGDMGDMGDMGDAAGIDDVGGAPEAQPEELAESKGKLKKKK
jgi:hypothetical protein